MPMIPFFDYLSGERAAIASVVERLRAGSGKVLALFGDGTQVNLEDLQVPHVDWALKQMVQAAHRSGLAPFHDLFAYGEELYEVAYARAELVWPGDFTPAQRAWIDACRGR